MEIIAVSAGSVAGVAARIALLNACTRAKFFANSSQISVNMLGSFLIGTISASTNVKEKLPSCYAAMAVGFCGSLTTFSSWIYAIVKPGSEWSVELITGLSIPFVAFLLGRDCIGFLKIEAPTERNKGDMLDRLTAGFMGLAVVVTMTVLAVTNAVNHKDLVTCSVGPLGALTRFFLSKSLNGKFLENFMIGTLLANVVAVILVGALTSCRESNDWCDYSIVGIAGSLSTVSSWVLDTFNIYPKSRQWAYFYCLSSVAVSVGILLPFV